MKTRKFKTKTVITEGLIEIYSEKDQLTISIESSNIKGEGRATITGKLPLADFLSDALQQYFANTLAKDPKDLDSVFQPQEGYK